MENTTGKESSGSGALSLVIETEPADRMGYDTKTTVIVRGPLGMKVLSGYSARNEVVRSAVLNYYGV